MAAQSASTNFAIDRPPEQPRKIPDEEMRRLVAAAVALFRTLAARRRDA